MAGIAVTDIKEMSGVVSFILMLVGSVPYVRAVLKGETKPHLFSWIIWHLVDDIAVAAQFAAGAGAGLLATLAGSLASLGIAFLAIQRRAAITITRFDWSTFAITLSAIPLWIITKEPLSAALIATAINAAAFLITMRKAWADPASENATAYLVYTAGWLFGILALVDYNLTSTLYPLVGMIMNFAVALIVMFRPRGLKK